MDRMDAIKAIAFNLGDLIIDAQPVSLTGSTLQFDELVQPLSQQLQGFYGYVYTGAGVGQERVIGSFNPTRNEVVFPQVFATTPSLNSSVVITEHFRKKEYDSAVDRYIGKARSRFLEDMVATAAFVATQYEYLVPSGMEWISTLRLIPSGNSDYRDVADIRRVFELPPRFWRIEANQGGSYVIAIDSRKVNLDNFDNQIINIEGQAKPDITGTDNAIIPPDLEEYIVAGASMLLSSQRIKEDREWLEKFRIFRSDYNEENDIIFRYGRGKKVR